MTHLDGNGAAGMLREIFTMEMTGAACRCPECGRTSAVGGLMLYGGVMGNVLRCPGCQSVLLRVTETPSRWSLEIRGVVRIDRTAAEPGAAR